MRARPTSDDGAAPDTGDDAPGIQVRLDALLIERGMTLTELSDRVGVTVVNLSILKNGHARAIRFSTLASAQPRLCFRRCLSFYLSSRRNLLLRLPVLSRTPR